MVQHPSSRCIPWAHAATDAPKLRSLLLFPDSYQGCSLRAHPQQLYALSHEVGQQEGGQYMRFTVYHNTQAATAPPAAAYQHAAQQLCSLAAPHSFLKGSAIPDEAVPAITGVLEQRGWVRTYCQPCHQFTCSPATVSEEAVSAAVCRLPEQYVMGELTQADAALVDRLWTFRSGNSLRMIQDLIASSHHSCVRTRDGGPVCWMLEVEPLCGGMLHVLEGHRQQGLAKAVCLDLFSKLQKKWQQRQAQRDVAALVGEPSGDGVYCYVVEDNAASMRLMGRTLNLQHTGVFTWLGFEKQPPPSSNLLS